MNTLRMANDFITLKDPLNNEVRLPKKFENELLSHDYIDKDLSLTIIKPAIIILPKIEEDSLYYARLVDWEITVLLKSEWQQGFWIVTECFWDVDSKFLKDIMSNGDCITF
jgi:hypothetical protein